jgi:hypothetical protein
LAAFEGCASLTNVTMADGVASIGVAAFDGCTGLTSVTIPGSVTNIGDNAFYDCTRLASIYFLGNAPAVGGNVLSGGYTTVYYLPGTTGWSYTFANLLAVLEYTSQAQFNYTTNAGAIAITGYTGADGAVNIPPAINGLPVTSITTNAFSNMTSLTNVIIPGSVTSIGDYAFSGSTNLTGAYFNGNAPTVGSWVFLSDSNATVYYLPGIAGWGSPFAGLPSVAEYTSQTQFSYTTNAGAITIAGYTGPGGAVYIPPAINALPVTTIGTNAFENSGLSSVTIPGSVTSIGQQGFYACSGLTSVTIPGSVSSLGLSAFEDCSRLTSVTISNGVSSLGPGAFFECWGLTNVTIPGSVTNIGDSAFTDCIRLKAITVDAQNSFYSSLNGVLFDKSQSTLIEYPGGLGGSYTIPDSVTSIGEGAFTFCSGLTGITIPGSVTNIGANAFADTYGLTSVTIRAGITSIGADAFSGCSDLTSITIPGSVTSIGYGAFYDCPSLTSITIPGSVTNIGEYAFRYCTSLSSVFFQGNAPAADSTLLENGGSVTVYYLPGTAGWHEFSANTGVLAVLWNPLIQAGGVNFGLRAGKFGFDITSTTHIPIVVEACTDLASPVWVPLQTLTLTAGSFHFSDPQWTNYSHRYYSLQMP